MEENIRFIELLDALRSRHLVSDYVAAAQLLDTNKAAISDIKACRKKLSISTLRRMKSSFPQISLDWVIMGIGSMFIEEKNIYNPPTCDDNILIKMIEDKDSLIRMYAEEIGRLKERIKQLENKFE